MAIIIIVSILLAAAVVYIIIAINSFSDEELAYDGKYYPATVIEQIYLNSDSTKIIVDFSLYDQKKLVGFFIYSELKGDDTMQALVEYPAIIKNAVVYQKRKGLWKWKSIQ